MELGEDLTAQILSEHLRDRPLRSYPAVLSTHADALAWARAGAPEGATVVADYQASPRGRAGLEWHVKAGSSLSFSLILRPRLTPEREGWLYTVATSALADVMPSKAEIEWPDEVHQNAQRVAATGVHVELGPEMSEWAVIDIFIPTAPTPRALLLARIITALESRYAQKPESVLAEYLPRCRTIGCRVRARMIPMGPTGPQISGKAVGALMDGALLIETDKGSRVAVRPQNLGLLEREGYQNAIHPPTNVP